MTKKKMNENGHRINLMRPDEIHAYLDKYVIGQEEAKKTLSIAVYNHYKRILHNYNGDVNTSEIEKSNCLICGPTGVGKTMMIKTIAKLLNVPCYIQDCSKITSSGYVGSDAEECIVGLLRSCDYDIDRAQIGIIVLDECDKISKKEAGPSITRDVSGECVQQSLLKIVEGDIVGVPPAGGRKHPEQSLLYVDTTNILFIGIGAFVGLDSIIKSRMNTNTMGFFSDNTRFEEPESYYKYVTPHDLKDYGFIPEFIGRFPIVCNVNKLSVESLLAILKEPKNALIKQYGDLLQMDGVKLTFEDKALEMIAQEAYDLNTGARALRSIIEKVLEDVMYEAPLKALNGVTEIQVTADMVEQRCKIRKIA